MTNTMYQKIGDQRLYRSRKTGQFVSSGKKKDKKKKPTAQTSSKVKNGKTYFLDSSVSVRALQVCNNNLRLVSLNGFNLFGFVKDSQLTRRPE